MVAHGAQGCVGPPMITLSEVASFCSGTMRHTLRCRGWSACMRRAGSVSVLCCGAPDGMQVHGNHKRRCHAAVQCVRGRRTGYSIVLKLAVFAVVVKGTHTDKSGMVNEISDTVPISHVRYRIPCEWPKLSGSTHLHCLAVACDLAARVPLPSQRCSSQTQESKV